MQRQAVHGEARPLKSPNCPLDSSCKFCDLHTTNTDAIKNASWTSGSFTGQCLVSPSQFGAEGSAFPRGSQVRDLWGQKDGGVVIKNGVWNVPALGGHDSAFVLITPA